MNNVYPHSSRSGGFLNTPDLWAYVAATDGFVKQPEQLQQARAAEFYDSVMTDLAADYYFDAGPYRETFIHGSSAADLTTTGDRPYRDVLGYSLARQGPKRDLPRLTKDAALMAIIPTTLLVILGAHLASRQRLAMSARSDTDG